MWTRAAAIVVDVVGLSWFVLALGLDVAGGVPQPNGPYDVVVVAGAGVREGGVASEALWARTRRGVELWHQGVAPKLAFTGGVGDWPPAEAVVARDLAAGWGVPTDRMVVEDGSRSTEENASHASLELGDVDILVVTDRYHVVRCKRVFGRYFSEVSAVGVRSPARVRLRGALREVLALGWYAVSGRI